MIVPRMTVMPSDGPAVSADRALLGAELSRLARSRVFFAHQSVGMNLLDGVRELASAYPEIPMRVESDAGHWDGGIRHAYVGENGDPQRKLEGFRQALDSGIGVVADLAFLKLCYSDFTATTDPVGLFASYQRTIADIRRDYPRLAVVHVTVPITAVPGRASASAAVKGLFGRPPSGIVENSVREEFNQLIRHANAGTSLVFDLARLESTTPAGERELRPWRGRLVPCLHPGYTNDGGHLNATARLRFGRALIAFLASKVQGS